MKALNGGSNLTNFISEYKCSYNICDDLIEFYDQNKHLHHPGLTSTQTLDKSKKDSMDLCIEANDNAEPIDNYIKSLWDNMYDYAKQYPKLNDLKAFSISEKINIQKYPIGGGFKSWHCERDGAFNQSIKRVLVFMTYLNDVDDGGTEFIYQNKIEKAEKGKTLIWPSDWTHTHRGQVSHTKEKMIITGWFSHLWDV